jgi:ribosomal-protein-alanine N-acetyltransferase
MKIDTNRLVLRDLEVSDIHNIFALSQDPEVTKYMDYICFKNLDEARVWVEDKIKYNNQTPRYAYNFSIRLKDSDEFIGWIGIGQAEDKSKGDMDFGYAISKNYWGNGYAPESLKAILETTWKETTANKIFGEARVQNTASIKVMEKSCMQFETKFTEDNHESVRYFALRPH